MNNPKCHKYYVFDLSVRLIPKKHLHSLHELLLVTVGDQIKNIKKHHFYSKIDQKQREKIVRANHCVNQWKKNYILQQKQPVISLLFRRQSFKSNYCHEDTAPRHVRIDHHRQRIIVLKKEQTSYDKGKLSKVRQKIDQKLVENSRVNRWTQKQVLNFGLKHIVIAYHNEESCVDSCQREKNELIGLKWLSQSKYWCLRHSISICQLIKSPSYCHFFIESK